MADSSRKRPLQAAAMAIIVSGKITKEMYCKCSSLYTFVACMADSSRKRPLQAAAMAIIVYGKITRKCIINAVVYM